MPTPGGPKVVALGGGHGLATTLRAVRAYAGHITAVVSVADDGGSSGRLRKAFGIPAPGDLRRCFGALADDESLLAQAFEHRFDSGELDGHPVGNLLIAGLTAASGDFVAALAETGRLLQACGDVLPATADPVVLLADIATGNTITGQVEVDQTQDIERIRLEPPAPPTPPSVLEAIAAADQIVIGPGSLHTSLLAVLAVPDVNAALRQATAETVFVANLRAVRSTMGWDLGRHLAALAAHEIHPQTVLVDENTPLAHGEVAGSSRVVRRPIARFDVPAHDPVQLAKALADLVG
ncbi:MAG: uridine diphosphate-N-acetylglucosamine-binding protein YvcK [Actinobacteria bacterium]|nr:uridine diphosphate-N-acetylglucosamine-binding protein YvcK [Actinomycetota bacterium]